MQPRALLCTCNNTVSIDAERLSAALAEAGTAAPGISALRIEQADELCRRECTRATSAMDSADDLIIGCTQEAPLFTELAEARRTVAPIRFVNLREQAGWGDEGERAHPKLAALIAAAASAVAEPVAAVSYQSRGRLLVIGEAADAMRWADRLAGQLTPAVLVTKPTGKTGVSTPLPSSRTYPIFSGDVSSVRGWLGQFDVQWAQRNPIDLESCVRCGACVSACPEGAIDALFQVDASRCTGHRACVEACGTIGAIDFSRTDTRRTERYDLVLDLRQRSAFAVHEPPQGYFHASDDEVRIDAALKLTELVGEFEKPKYFRYDEKLCAHSRNGIEGCRRCIDVCSTGAIRSDAPRVTVEPHLCMGCGACATVCPSGAMSFQYPTPRVVGKRVRDALAAFAAAGGVAPAVLFHDGKQAASVLMSLGRGAGSAVKRAPRMRGLPARVVPVEVHHAASVGLDLMLSAIAFGASQVAVLLTGSEAPQYRDALLEQTELAQALLTGLGYRGTHFVVIQAADAASLETATHALRPAQTVQQGARFALADEKRRSVEFALDHLSAEATAAGRGPTDAIALPNGAPFGTLRVDADKCTLCLACIGSCPESALLDHADAPQLRFIERNCVQCGLCASTCPEDAITLEARYRLDAAARQPRLLNAAQPFDCISCGKPFGTRRMIDVMLGRLANHPMFGGQGARRLQMCGDCRVVDMATNKAEATIFDVTGPN